MHLGTQGYIRRDGHYGSWDAVATEDDGSMVLAVGKPFIIEFERTADGWAVTIDGQRLPVFDWKQPRIGNVACIGASGPSLPRLSFKPAGQSPSLHRRQTHAVNRKKAMCGCAPCPPPPYIALSDSLYTSLSFASPAPLSISLRIRARGLNAHGTAHFLRCYRDRGGIYCLYGKRLRRSQRTLLRQTFVDGVPNEMQ